MPPQRRTLVRSIGDAKAHFAECIRDAEAGREVVITRHGRPVARLEPIPEQTRDAERRLPEEVAKPGDLAEPATPYAAASVVFQSPAARRTALRRRLADQIWPRIPAELLGRGVTKREREEILGYVGDGESPPVATDR
jgi:antitoxin VapB